MARAAARIEVPASAERAAAEHQPRAGRGGWGLSSSPGGGRARREAAEAAPSRHPLGMRQGEAWPRRKHRARKLPHVWERSSRAARTPARAKRRPRQNDVLENRLFRAPLQLLRATAKRTAAAREAAATRGDNRQPCSSGTLQPRVKRGGAHGRGRQCREALRLLMPRCFGRGGCAAAIAAKALALESQDRRI